VFSPSGTWASSVGKSLLMSPDHVEPLHAGVARAAEQEHALIRARGRFALGEGLVPEAVVDVVQQRAVSGGEGRGGGRALAAVEPPAPHTQSHQLPVGRPPPAPHDGIREVEMSLALPVVGGTAGGALVAGREQIAARLGLGEERRGLVEHGVLVGDDLEVLRSHLVEQGLRFRPQLRLELQVTDAAVPAECLAVARQIDQRVAGNPLLANRAGQPAQLVGVLEVPRGLQEAQRPARGQCRPPQQIRHLAQEAAQVGADQEVPRERSTRRRVDDADTVVRATDRGGSVGGTIEEERVAPVGDQERHAQVRARAVPELGVPQLAHRPQPVEASAALPQPIEVLLAHEREGRPHAARGGVGLQAAGRGLVQERGARRVGERQPQRRRRDLEPESARGQPHRLAVDDLERHLRPVARADE
jgi:hypothetical protein